MRQLSFKLFLIGLIFSFVGIAQNNMQVDFYDTLMTHGYQLKLNTELNYSASKMQNKFMDKFIKGGHIDEALKQKTFDRLNDNNTIGAVIGANLIFRDFKTVLFKKKPRYGYQIGYGYHILAGGSYGKDVFELGFFGNSGTQGRSMDLENLQFNFQSFHKLSFGFFDKKSKSSVSLSYIHGTNFIDFSMFDGNLETSDSTNNLHLLLDGYFHQSNSKKGFFAPNGWGLALDADFIIPIKWFKGKKAYFQIKLENLGFTRWNEESTIYRKDTIYSFNGFEIDNIANIGSLTGDGQSIADTLNIKAENKRITSWLPASFSVSKIYDTHNSSKFQSIFGIHIMTQGGFRPLGYAGVVYRPVKWFYTGIHVMYGGYGQFRGGLQLNFRAKEKYSFHLSTNDIIGLVSSVGTGRSLHFGMKFDL